MIDWLGYFPHLWWHRGELPPRTGLRHPHFCPYGPYPAADELFSLAVLSDAHWRALCTDVVGRLDLLEDGRYATNESRVTYRADLEPELEAVFATQSAVEWLDRLRGAGIPCGAVNDLEAVLRHPQLEHNKLIAEVDSPAGPIPTVGNPFLVDGARPGLGPVPGLGEGGRVEPD
jgi:crotonobetainyl-CoA:carnitine CoA-transferase CaiB-like acyl-CoA transferase